jgi:putative FmdB family regulatory protein
MPTYEYECPRCPRVFEVKQRITEPALQTCDRCGGPIHRLLSAAPFILKGEGWYVTDYPSEARKKARESEKGGDKAPASPEKSSTGASAETASKTDAPVKSTAAASPSTASTSSSSSSSSSE